MKILSYVGSHDVVIYQNAVYDPSIRKYRGGTPAAVIPYSGRMLSATAKPAREEMVLLNGVEIPVHAASEWDHVDSLPAAEECDFALVSALYAAVCQKLGLNTSRLLTIGVLPGRIKAGRPRRGTSCHPYIVFSGWVHPSGRPLLI